MGDLRKRDVRRISGEVKRRSLAWLVGRKGWLSVCWLLATALHCLLAS